ALRGEAGSEFHGAVRAYGFEHGTKISSPRSAVDPFRRHRMKTLADAFEHTLKDIYYAENAIARALPKVIEAVSQSEFKSALLGHLAETREQIKILVKVFKTIGVAASGEKCHAIEGLIKETESILSEAKGSVARNAALAGACQA